MAATQPHGCTFDKAEEYGVVSFGYGSTNCEFYGNKILNTSGGTYGMFLRKNGTDGATDGCKIYNNIFTTWLGISDGGAELTNCQINNNTFVGTGDCFPDLGSANQVKNNIVSAADAGGSNVEFANAALDDNYKPTSASYNIVGKADQTLEPADDFEGTTRVNHTVGAYEGAEVHIPITMYASATATSGGKGTDASPYTVAEAITAAGLGDIIVLKAGTYAGDIAIADKKNLTIKGEDGKASEIDGSLTATNCAGIKISGLNITAGATADAVTLTDCDNATVTKCNIKDSQTGVVTLGTTSKPTVTVVQNKIKGCETAVKATKTIIFVVSNLIYNGTKGVVCVKGATDYVDTDEIYVYSNTFYNISGLNIDADQPNNVDTSDSTKTFMGVWSNIFARPESAAKGAYIQLLTKEHGFDFGFNLYYAAADDIIANIYGGDNTLAQEQAGGDDGHSKLYTTQIFKNVDIEDFAIANKGPVEKAAIRYNDWTFVPTTDLAGTDYVLNLETGAFDTGAYAVGTVSDPAPAFLVGTATYYVDAASTAATPDGSKANPYKTIGAAVTASASAKFATIDIAAGTYNEALTITDRSNLTIKGAGGDKVFVTGTDGDAGWGAPYVSTLAIGTSSNIEVSGITFDYQKDFSTAEAGDVAYNSTAILMGSTDIKVHNCVFTGTSGLTSGVQMNSACDNVTFECNTIKNALNGFYFIWGNTSEVSNPSTIIQNNIITCQNGINLTPESAGYQTSANMKIVNNTITGKVVHSALAAGKNDVNLKNITIANNIMGSLTLQPEDMAAAQNVVVTNNVYIGNGTDAGEVSGVGTNEITAVPTDVFTDYTNGDYTVKQGSAVVGAGSATYALASDFEGTKRLNNTVGAYEGKQAVEENAIYVSSTASANGAGTMEDPYTLANAITAATADSSIKKIILAEGTYAYSTAVTAKIARDAAHPLDIVGKTKGKVVITGSASATFELTESSYVNIYNINFLNTKTTYGYWDCLYVASSNHITVHDCVFKASGDDSMGLQFGKNISDSDIYNNSFSAAYGGIYATGDLDASKTPLNAMNNCKIYNNMFVYGCYGMWFQTLPITNSKIYNNTSMNSGTEINGIIWDSYSTGNIVENNIINGCKLVDETNIFDYNCYTGDYVKADDPAYAAYGGKHSTYDSAMLKDGRPTIDSAAIIGKADPNLQPAFDFDGTTRSRNTIGAIEYIPPVVAGSYYVKSGTTGGDGTEAKPFGNISDAVDKASDASEIILMTGTYTEDVTVSGLNKLTIKAGSNQAPVINGTVTATKCSNLTIQGLNIIAGNQKDAITLTDCASALVIHNNIKESRTGIVAIGATSTPSMNINYNKIKRCTTAIDISKCNTHVMANVIYNGTTGIVIKDSFIFYIYNDTFYNVMGENLDIDAAPDSNASDNASKRQICSNVFSRWKTGQGSFIQLSDKTDSVTAVCNLYDAQTNDIVADNGTLSQFDPDYSKLGSPKFADPLAGDFAILDGSFAIGAGQRGAGWRDEPPVKDITGKTYIYNTTGSGDYDAGAYDRTVKTDPESTFMVDTKTYTDPKTVYVSMQDIASDTNDGSSTKPYQTIAKAFSVLNPGDALIIGAGKYANVDVTLVDKAGTSGQSIDISAAQYLGTSGKYVYSNVILNGTLDFNNCGAVNLTGVTVNAANATNGKAAITFTNTPTVNINQVKVTGGTIGLAIDGNNVKTNKTVIYRSRFSNLGTAMTVKNWANAIVQSCIFEKATTGIEGTANPNITATNNTFYDISGYSITATQATNSDTDTTNNTVFYNVNNIFSRTTRSGAPFVAVIGKTHGFTSENNLYDADTTQPILNAYGKNCVLADLQTADKTGDEENAVLGKPGFVDPTTADYHLKKANLVVDKGYDFSISNTSIPAWTYDFDGVAGTVGKNGEVVIGAYNYVTSNDNEQETLPNFTLDNKSIAENSAIGTTIGKFVAINGEEGKTYTYTLTSGLADNAYFTIVNGNTLQVNGAFNYEIKKSYSIAVVIHVCYSIGTLCRRKS